MYHDDYHFDHETLNALASRIDLTEERLAVAESNSCEGQYPYYITEGLPFVLALYALREIDLDALFEGNLDDEAVEEFAEENDLHPEDIRLIARSRGLNI